MELLTIDCGCDLHGLGVLALLGARLHPDHHLRLQEHHQINKKKQIKLPSVPV
jgi:hypothetical protein